MPTPAGTTASLSLAPHAGPIEIPGLLYIAVEEYISWQQLRVSSETLKEDAIKARDLAIANGLDLKQIYEDQDLDFFVKHGVEVGVARRFVSDIGHCANRRRRNNSRQ